jgi:hypothetical protein
MGRGRRSALRLEKETKEDKGDEIKKRKLTV